MAVILLPGRIPPSVIATVVVVALVEAVTVVFVCETQTYVSHFIKATCSAFSSLKMSLNLT